MLRCEQLRIVLATAFLVLAASFVRAEKPKEPLDRYVLDYPEATEFCPPVASYFDDVNQAIQKVGGRTFRHQLNGGYGLPVVSKIGDKHLLHVGADLAWHRAGEPVYAMAAGIVRVSQGPPRFDKGESRKEVGDANSAAAKTPARKSSTAALNRAIKQAHRALGWGNLIVIEHRLSDGSFVTSIYGHLGPKRLVAVGDVVQAGQKIGTIGRAGEENGGYKPHLHFGLREGRMFEPGGLLTTAVIDMKPVPIKLVSLNETDVELSSESPLPSSIQLAVCQPQYSISYRDGKLWLPAAALNHIWRPDFIAGYALSTEGWRDPTEFLLQMLNAFPRAPFGAPAVPAARKIPAEASAKLAGERRKDVTIKAGSKLPRIYNHRSAGKSLVKSALLRAKKTDNRVLLLYGENGCGWCHKLHALFVQNNDIRACLQGDYELVMIDMESDANQKLAASYKAELTEHGVPYLTVLNAEGQVLANQETETFEDGKQHDPAKVLAFLKEHSAQAAAAH